MCLLQDGGTADPAIASDWEKAVEYALAGGEADAFKLFSKSPWALRWRLGFRKWNNVYVGLLAGGILGSMICHFLLR